MVCSLTANPVLYLGSFRHVSQGAAPRVEGVEVIEAQEGGRQSTDANSLCHWRRCRYFSDDQAINLPVLIIGGLDDACQLIPDFVAGASRCSLAPRCDDLPHVNVCSADQTQMLIVALILIPEIASSGVTRDVLSAIYSLDNSGTGVRFHAMWCPSLRCKFGSNTRRAGAGCLRPRVMVLSWYDCAKNTCTKPDP